MERKIQNLIDNSFQEFKNDIISKLKSNNSEIMITDELINYISCYECIKLKHDDFKKRKRIKNNVPLYDRCCALRADGQQCTRKKHETSKFCGTHIKGTPNGILNNEDNLTTTKKIEIRTQDINGIVYYIDNDNNVYDPCDILKNNNNPKIIATYVLNNETYIINNKI